MATNWRVRELRAQLKSAGGDVSGRHRRVRWSLPLFATLASVALVSVTLAPPAGSVPAFAAEDPAPAAAADLQSLAVAGDYANGVGRDGFSVTEPVVIAPAAVSESESMAAPAVGTPDPGTAQAIAYDMLLGLGMGDDQFNCLVALWNRESGWNVYANNSSSGAYGIPQALPGSKMSSAGADWATNPATQVSWGLSYITGRYSDPCGAWAHSEENGWY